MNDWAKILLPGLFGISTAILAAFLSARWSVKRASKEKWWDRKEKAYAEIIESLYDMIRFSEVRASEELTGESQGSNPKIDEFRAKHTDAYWKIQKATSIGAFVISEKATEVLEELKKRPRLEWGENPPWEIFEDDLTHYKSALARIRALAREELGV